jgi:hypothetical protein
MSAKLTNDDAMVGVGKYPREAFDLYRTPAWVTRTLLRHISIGSVWEPSAGLGDMVHVLQQEGVRVEATDLVDHGAGYPLQDFLQAATMRGESMDIVMNPPYLNGEDHVRKALELTKPGKGLVAALMRNEWDAAKTRCDLFQLPPFAMKIVLFDRPQWFPDRAAQPRHNFAWFVWDWRYKAEPLVRYDGDKDKPNYEKLRNGRRIDPPENDDAIEESLF